MKYQFEKLSNELVYIRWFGIASDAEAFRFLEDLEHWIRAASNKVYFISDLRRGHIVTVRVLREMARLAADPHYGGGPCLVEDRTSEVYVRLFERFIEETEPDFIFDSQEAVLANLESLKPGITQGLDWEQIFSQFARR